MRKLITVMALVVVVALSVPALTLTPDQALSRALSSGNATVKSPAASPLTLAYTASQPGTSLPAVYVFANTKSYLVASADDCAAPVLGYGDNSDFSIDDMPPAMKWWLDEYSRQIEAYRGSASTGALTFAVARTERAPIEPLVKTIWNQSAPFNDLCPTLNGNHAVTGCVATAMAQVMNYHQYPAKGTGSNSYTLNYNNSTVSLDFSTITFDWPDMIDSYNGTYTSAEATAVAKLMYACGVSTNMQYTPSESGTSSYDVALALYKYFGYDPAVVCLGREYFSAQDWEDVVYRQLTEYGPVQYSGSNTSSGHSFVCDGYQGDGYFHINWGWGGMSNGYFLLSALNPGQQGIGGSTSGYNSGQDIIANVSAPRQGSSLTVCVTCPNGFSFNTTSATLGQVVNFEGPIFNMSSTTVNGYLGIKMVNNSTGQTYYAVHPNSYDLEPASGFSYFGFYMPSELPEGTYTVTPGIRDAAGKWTDALVGISYGQTATMKVTGNTAAITYPEGAVLTTANLAMGTPLYLGSKFTLTATIANAGQSDFYGTVMPALISDNSIVALGDEVALNMKAGATTDFSYMGALSQYANNTQPSPGSYSMCLVYRNGSSYTPFSNIIDVTLNSATTASIQVTSFKVMGDTNAVDPDNVNIQAVVKCNAGYFSDALTAVIFNGSTGYSVAQVSQTQIIQAGSQKTISFKLAIPSPDPSITYSAGLYRGNYLVSPSYVPFSISANTGIGTVIVDGDAPADQPLYDLTGRRVVSPQAGHLYIRLDGKKVVAR